MISGSGVLGFRVLGFSDFGFRGLRVEGFIRGKGGELQGKPEPQETFLHKSRWQVNFGRSPNHTALDRQDS